jgi:hypothetical protein
MENQNVAMVRWVVAFKFQVARQGVNLLSNLTINVKRLLYELD